jgi:hypothetical protein
MADNSSATRLRGKPANPRSFPTRAARVGSRPRLSGFSERRFREINLSMQRAARLIKIGKGNAQDHAADAVCDLKRPPLPLIT